MLNGKESLLVLYLEQTYCLIYVTADAHTRNMSHDKIAALDLGMLAVLIKVCGQIDREIIKHARIVEYVRYQPVNAVILKPHVIMEHKTLLTLERAYKVLGEQGVHILAQRKQFLGAYKRLLIGLVTDIVQRQALYLHF